MATKSLTERAETLQPLGLAPLLSRQELEALYGVSEWTVRKWVKDGCPVEPSPLATPRFDLQKVREWMAQQNTAAA